MQAQETELAKRDFGPFFIINILMKIIAVNLTDTEQTNYFNQLSTVFGTEIIPLSYKDIDNDITGDLYTKLSLGALSLEQYVIDHPEYNSPNKSFINALMFWEPNLEQVDKLVPYKNLFIKNWFILQEQENPKWIFGNISALTKWAGSLYKINKNDFYFTHPHMVKDFTPSLVYAGRIGINVQGLI